MSAIFAKYIYSSLRKQLVFELSTASTLNYPGIIFTKLLIFTLSYASSQNSLVHSTFQSNIRVYIILYKLYIYSSRVFYSCNLYPCRNDKCPNWTLSHWHSRGEAKILMNATCQIAIREIR